MFFVVDRARLERMIGLTRDDRPKDRFTDGGPYFRLEADEGHLRLTGRRVEAQFSATVYEPGVLFLRVTLLRDLLATMRDAPTLAIQANTEGVFIENVRLSLDVGQMLLYPIPASAPQRHPAERLGDSGPSEPLESDEP